MSWCIQRESDVTGVVERGRYSDQNWKNTLLTFAVSPSLLSPRSIWLFCLLHINLSLFLSALSPSICLPLPDHFTLLSTSPLPSGLYLCLVFSLQPFHFPFSLLSSSPTFYPFNTLNISFTLLPPSCYVPLCPSYLSLAGGEDLEGLDLFLLTIPGHRLCVQDAGHHRVLLHLLKK